MDQALASAAAQAEALLASGGGDAYDWMVASLGRAERGDRAGAEAGFARALALEPDNPAVLTGAAAWYRREGRLRDAILACDAAIRIAPDYPDAWIERAVAYATGGSSATARASFARAAALAPHSAVAHAGFAALAARDGQIEAARTAARRALSLDPANLIATGALASISLEAGDAEAARALLEPIVGTAPPGPDRSQALTLLGNAHARLGDTDAAFAQYQRANDDFAAQHAEAAQRFLPATVFIEAIHDGLAAVPRTAWHEPEAAPDSARPNHVFLIGYPRSGTTLVENVLASLPGVAALEERPTLAAADRRFLMGNPGEIAAGLDEFATLDATALDELRQAYWDKVAAAGIPADTGHFVDMDPLKGTRLPFIARLFPAATVVVMRRDPRDVVWSCFKTNFAATSGTLEYTTLERAARHYAALMRLTDLALATLPLHAFELDYRALVRDFDATTQALCNFTGIPWSEDVRRFDRTAQARGVATASASQVRKGLYDGTGQWRPFARQLEPVLPLLAPWIERFGYDD